MMTIEQQALALVNEVREPSAEQVRALAEAMCEVVLEDGETLGDWIEPLTYNEITALEPVARMVLTRIARATLEPRP